jgi:pyruvate/2-oxoglutarate dehydrogenase complex dihydrolipoamide acyltransferase (E2) component
MFQFKVPDIGEGMVEAEVLAWRVAEGDVVEEDQILVDLMTDKAEIEIPSPRAGRVHRLHADVGDIVPVGAVLIEIDDGAAGESTAPPRERAAPRPEARARPAQSVAPAQPEQPDAPAQSAAPAAPATPPADRPPELPARPRSRQLASARGTRVEAVPAVRELARRLGVELEQVQGTGPAGRIMRRDVERHRSGSAPEGSVAVFAPPERDEADWERRPLRGT